MIPSLSRAIPVVLIHAVLSTTICLKTSIADDPTAGPEIAIDISEPATNELTEQAQNAADDLAESLADGSEARAMFDAVIQGRGLGIDQGWFAVARSANRFGWDHVKESYDADGDGRVSPPELGTDRAGFATLDRNGDGSIEAADLDWNESSLTPTAGSLLFFRADEDANGKVSKDEFGRLFDSLDRGSRGFISSDDLRDQFASPRTKTDGPSKPRLDGEGRSELLLALEREEIGSLQSGPNLNDPAPDFTLTSLEGKQVTLSEEIGELPIVLVFGNFTCGPFRSHAGNIEKLYKRYHNQAKFFLVYVREAHPSDGWRMTSNQRVGIDVGQPVDDQQRRQVARTCQQHLDLDLPFLVDTIDDAVGKVYSGMPNRLYLIDPQGRIAFKSGRGPYLFHPRELEQSLVLMLKEMADQTDGI